MMKRTPLFTALSAVGLCASAYAGVPPPPTSVSALCGTTLTENTVVGCYGSHETFTGNCTINVAADVNLTIGECEVDADDYDLQINGASGASLHMSGTNGSISGATNINFDFQGIGDRHCYGNVIDVDNYDLIATGDSRRGGGGSINLDVKNCGDIDIYTNSGFGNIIANHTILMNASNGAIAIHDNNDWLRIEAGTSMEFYAPRGNISISGFSIETPSLQATGLGYGNVQID